MDIITHAATGVLLSTAFDDPMAKAACITASVVPDVTLAPIYRHIYQKKKDPNIIKHVGCPKTPLPQKTLTLYWLAHSFIPIGFIFLVSLFLKNPVLIAFCVGYLSHLFWDIPTHTNDYACRPLYPFSEKKWEGVGDWWRSKIGIASVAGVWTTLGGVWMML